jgi:hypothetical protein
LHFGRGAGVASTSYICASVMLLLHGIGFECLHGSPASCKRRRKKKPSAWGYNWATLFLGHTNTGTWPSNVRESRISDSTIWSRVPRDSDLRMIVLARTSSSCKRQTRPLVREVVPHQQTRNWLTVTKIWSWTPDGGLTPRQTVGRNITLILVISNYRKFEIRLWCGLKWQKVRNKFYQNPSKEPRFEKCGNTHDLPCMAYVFIFKHLVLRLWCCALDSWRTWFAQSSPLAEEDCLLKSSTVDWRCSAVNQYQALCEFHIFTHAVLDRINRDAISHQGLVAFCSKIGTFKFIFHFNPQSCHIPFKYSAMPSFIATVRRWTLCVYA